jgi:uncharacterized membrane protein YccC
MAEHAGVASERTPAVRGSAVRAERELWGPIRRLLARGPTGTAVRTAITGTVGFQIGVWVVDDLQFAVFAAFTGIALSGFADFGGSLRGRAVANVTTGSIAVALVAIGTIVSDSVIFGPIAALLLTFVVILAGGLGGYARAASRVLVIFLVLAIGIPAPVADIPDRIGGVLLGTALATGASVLLWQRSPRREIEAAIADAATAIASGLATIASGAAQAASAADEAEAAVKAAREKAARLGATPAGPVARDRSRAYLIDDLERATRVMSEIRHPPAPEHEHPAVREILDVGRERISDARRLFLGVADALRGIHSAPVGEAHAALRRTEHDLSGVSVDPEDPKDVVLASEWALLANELAWTAGIASTHASASPVPLGRGDTDAERSLGETEPELDVVRRSIGVIRADLSLHSVRFQDSVRTALALGVAVGLTAALDLSHGFWVSLATLTVLKTAARATAISAFDAIVGTLVGFALSVLIVLAADVEHPVYGIALPILIFMSIWATGAIGLAAGQAAFTMTVVVLFNLLEPAGWELGIARVEDVVVGAAAGIVIAIVAWPRGSRVELGHATGALVSAAARYAGLVMGGLLVGQERRGVDRPERLEVKGASQRLDEVIQLSMAEGRPGTDQMAHWLAIAGEAHRLWYIADHDSLAPVDDTPACRPLVVYLESAVRDVTSLYEAAGNAITAGEPPQPAQVIDTTELDDLVEACLARSRSKETVSTLARLLLIARWVAVASEVLRELRADVAQATAERPPELLGDATPAPVG